MHNSNGEASYKMVTWKNCEGDECITLRYVVGGWKADSIRCWALG